MGLFSKGWKNKDKQKALDWISKHKGKNIIDAMFSEDKDIKDAAINQLIKNDINTLGTLIYSFYNKCDKETKSRFIHELNNQSIITGLIKMEKDFTLNRELVSRITDQNILKDLASHSLEQAIDAITDQNIIYEILTNEKFYVDNSLLSDYQKDYARRNRRSINEVFAERLIEKFNDKDRLIDLLNNTHYESVLFKCMLKIRNEKIMDITKIVYDKKYSNNIRSEAITFIEDEKELCKFIDSDEEYALRLKAIERIKNPKIRKKYCKEYNAHKWKEIDVIHNDVGDRDYLKRIYECEYCGEKKYEDDTYIY